MATPRGWCSERPSCFSLFTDNVNLFAGVEITFNIKDGECQRVCCDAAGGHVKMVSSCESQTASNSSCEGFKSEEKEEKGHCPGEAEDLCSSACDNIAGDRGDSF